MVSGSSIDLAMSEGRSAARGGHEENFSMVKVAVIGVGSMGRNHARIYRELDQSELVAVCDAELSLAASIAEFERGTRLQRHVQDVG